MLEGDLCYHCTDALALAVAEPEPAEIEDQAHDVAQDLPGGALDIHPAEEHSGQVLTLATRTCAERWR